MRQAWFLGAAILVVAGAQAQNPPEAARGLEAGVRYWLSTGKTERGHDASGGTFMGFPLGNPTSVLAYDNLDANVIELYARKGFGDRWFVKGNLGIGRVNTGMLTDSDYLSVSGRQVLFVETISATSGNLQYATIDVGRDLWTRGNTVVGLFAGYQQWTEDLDGYGTSLTADIFDVFGPVDAGTLAISNKLTWRSVRLGAAMRSTRGRTRFTADLALVPYASYRNEDSHHLRTATFGPVPNIIATGHGWGGQFEAEVRRSFPDLWDLELALGYRYWRLEATSGNQTQAGRTFPIVDLVSERQGVTFTVSKTW
jgi:hypothetical protein